MRLHLGCGNNYMDGWENIDKNVNVRADSHLDIEHGLFYDDDSVDVIFAKHIIEHIKDDVKLFNEIYRVCKNGAKVEIHVPLASDIGAHDWDHKTFWNYRKFHYLNKDNRANEMGLDCDFKIMVHSIHKEGEKEIECDVLHILLEVVK